jgi:multidrug efflux pump
MENNNIDNKPRTFGLSSFAVDNGTSIFILSIMILLFGLRSYQSMPKESYPEASLPTVYINTPYFGNSAADIENLIARPLEKELSTINGLKRINSTSIQDFSVIIVEFDPDQDQDAAVRKVKDAVDKARSELPNDLDQEPSVLEIIFSEFPIMTVNVSGNYGMDELRELGEYIQDKIENISQVNKVDLKGALDREVKIDVDLLKMQSLQVAYTDIESAIAQENLSMSGGEIVANEFRRSIRVIGEFKNIEEIENVIIKSENIRPIYLKDLANVTYGFEDRTSYARSNGLPVISLDVIKRRGGNVIDVAAQIRTLIDEEKKNLPPDINIAIFNDISIGTKESVATLENSIISGVILVVLVLLFFLGLRNALFVGISIPLSMLMGILFLDMMGTSLNIIILFGLILSLGLLVDNAIVVVENVYRYMQEGYSSYDAAKYGAAEVAMPILASTATTLAAFIPLAMWPGIMGEFMQYFPITLIAVLSSSLFVALVINPVLTSRLMIIDKKGTTPERKAQNRNNVLIGALVMIVIAVLGHLIGKEWIRNLLGIATVISLVNFFLFRPGTFFFQNRGLPFLEKMYNRFIALVLTGVGPYIAFFSTILLLVGAIALLNANMPKVEYFPSSDPNYVNVFLELPLGSDIEATNAAVKLIESDVRQAVEPYKDIIEEILTQIGEDTSDPNSPPEPGVTPHKARITASFVLFQDRNGVSSQDAMDAIRAGLQQRPGVKFVVAKDNNGPPTGLPINIEIVGDEIETLTQESEKILNFLNAQRISGIEELKRDVVLSKPELSITVDREAARRYGLSTAQIAGAIRTSVFGKEISKFKVGEDEYPIVLRLDEATRNNTTAVMNQKITFRNQSNGRIVQVPISSVTHFDYNTSYNAIKRKDQKRAVNIYSNVIDGYNANEIVAQLKYAMDGYKLPPGYIFQFTGEQEQQAEDMAFLNGAFMIALFSIFIILVAQFNSLYSPFIIVITVVFSTIGVFLGYAITGRTIGVVFTGIGIISLAGIVVNNAIVLIDYINLLVQKKREALGISSILGLDKSIVKEAIIEGGATRLRPVLLTAITTVLGLVPLAIGFNINFFTIISELDPQVYIGGDTTALWGSLAWTVIYGLVFSTFLTLIIVPAMYWLAYRIKFRTEGYFYFKKLKENESGE